MCDALKWLENRLNHNAGALWNSKEEAFNGSAAKFQQAAEHVDAKLVGRFRQVLTNINEIEIEAKKIDLKEPNWPRLRQLALLRIGSASTADPSQPQFHPLELAGMLADSEDDAVGIGSAEYLEWFQPTMEKLKATGFDKRPADWTAADWRLVSFYHDTMCREEDDPEFACERTPILLASETVGKVLRLVAERRSGPAGLITPHWWRLGLVPLGKNNELLKAIHYGFRAVLNILPSKHKKFQIRWWLEDSKEGWHSEINEAKSVELSAACVARALSEESEVPRPLLDPKAGISATLETASGNWDEWPAGTVERVEEKRAAGDREELLTFGLHPDSTIEEDPNLTISQQPVGTFGEAYQAILQTTRKIADAKLKLSSSWCHSDELEDRLNRDDIARPEWVETLTHPDFIRASEEGESVITASETPSSEPKRRPSNSGFVREFLLGQPLWYADTDSSHFRWELAVREDEPTDEFSKMESAHRPPTRAEQPSEAKEIQQDEQPKWARLTPREEQREVFIQHTISDDEQWRRGGLVCGAGLGKSTNLEWLEAAINRRDKGRNRNLAFQMELRDLTSDLDELLGKILLKLRNQVDGIEEFTVRRMLMDGRVTFLLDALDQANPEPEGSVIKALEELLKSKWNKCRVWISGRPYAFEIARPSLERMAENPPWQFLRIGQLDEPECRHLLETTPSLGQPR